MNANDTLIIENLSHAFDGNDGESISVLDKISLKVPHGKIVSIIGPSGCGKSTLLDCISGLITPNEGTICYKGNSFVGKHEISYMTQSAAMLPWRKIIDNLTLPMEIQKVPLSSARKEAMSLLEEFNLEKWADYYPHTLSGGMLQRVSLLRAYLSKKEIMVLDEPFSKLDALTKLQIQEWFLRVWQKHKKTVIFVTHDIEEALIISDSIYVFSKRPAHILKIIKIPFVRPRTIALSANKDYLKLKTQLLQMFVGD